MNHMDAFEQRIRDVLEPFEVPYNSADWAQMEKALDDGGRTSWWGGLGFYAALIVGVLSIGGAGYLLIGGGPGAGQTDDLAIPERSTMILPIEPLNPGRTTRNEEPGTGASETLASTENSNVVRNDHAGRMKPSPSGDPAPRVGNTTLTAKKTTTEDALGPEQTSPNVRDLPVNADPDNGANDEGGAELAIRPSVTEGCPGTTVEFSAEHLPDEGIFLWNFGDGSFSNKPNPSHAYSKSGRFEVMLSHSSMAGGNIRNKPSSDLIVIHEAPEADFVPQPQQFNGHLPSTHFENRSLGGKQYHWDFGDGVTSNVPHPDHVYRKQGTYHVELVVTNARGCVDRQEKKVVVEHDYNLLAPEAFSPNGDGTNDLFIPEALRDLHLRFKLSIHDAASGELVYETTDATKPWTGRRSNRGDLCTAGTYVWVVEFPDAAHLSDIPFQGEVTLVR